MLLIPPPRNNKALMATIAIKARMSAYSARPCPLIRRTRRSAMGVRLQRRADDAQDLGDRAAQEQQSDNSRDGDQRQDESVFGQALAARLGGHAIPSMVTLTVAGRCVRCLHYYSIVPTPVNMVCRGADTAPNLPERHRSPGHRSHGCATFDLIDVLIPVHRPVQKARMTGEDGGDGPFCGQPGDHAVDLLRGGDDLAKQAVTRI